MLVLTKRMLGSDPAGFFSIMVLGRRSIGKTSYSLWGTHDFFVARGETDNNAWRMALSCLKFTIPEVIEFIDDAKRRKIKKPVLIWDDVRVYAGGSQYFLNMKLVSQLGGLLDVIRTRISNLILTCPSRSRLLGILNSYDDYIAKIHHTEKGGYDREARGYLWSSLPSGKRLIYHRFTDSYSCYLPQWVYVIYMDMREVAMESLLTAIKQEDEEIVEKKMRKLARQIKAHKLSKELKKLVEEKKLKL